MSQKRRKRPQLTVERVVAHVARVIERVELPHVHTVAALRVLAVVRVANLSKQSRGINEKHAGKRGRIKGKLKSFSGMALRNYLIVGVITSRIPNLLPEIKETNTQLIKHQTQAEQSLITGRVRIPARAAIAAADEARDHLRGHCFCEIVNRIKTTGNDKLRLTA